MEPGVRKYLLRILNTLGIGLLWMTINSTAGLMFGYGLVEGSFQLGNIVFYAWFFLSMLLFSWWIYRIWRNPISYEE
ncbi:MAG: hypothetical protein ACKO1T_06045 [Sediminibacterium sp.]